MSTRPDISTERLHIRDLAPGIAGPAQLVGIAALVIAVLLGMFTGGESFFRGYLVAFMFCLSISLGALFFVLIQHATKAGWSVSLRRIAENITMTFVPLAVLSLPLVLAMLLGMPASIHDVYPWTDAEHVAADEILTGKSAYLNVPFFVIRMIAYFGIWIWLSSYFYNTSVRQDHVGDDRLTLDMQRFSYPAIILFALTLTFCAFDLLMSLDPHWFSTIFGVYYFSGCVVAFHALLAIIMVLLQQSGRMKETITAEHYHDVGKMVFAFVVFWAYIAFSQYMLIWYANLPEETTFYVLRQTTTWLGVSLALLFGHFFIPFLGLISRIPKRVKGMLLYGAAWMLVMHLLDMFYLVMPHALHDQHGGLLLDANGYMQAAPLTVWDPIQTVLCLIGIGGIFVASAVRRAALESLVPERDPRLSEALVFENL